MAYNGFFGHITGPFEANENVYQKIISECGQDIDYISKIGIHYPVNFDYPLTFEAINNDNENQSSPFCYPIFINLYDAKTRASKRFQLGKTGMLELQDVKITNISFSTDVDDNMHIDYQYARKLI